MKVINDLKDFTAGGFSSIALGNFDGIHLGHQKLLKRLIESTERYSTKSVVFTFEPHPSQVLNGNDSPFLLTPLEDKIELISKYGVEYLVLMPFTDSFSKMSPEGFVKEILVDKMNVKYIVVGFNYKFGNMASGSVDDLSRLSHMYNFTVEIVPPITHQKRVISSSYIRELLQIGDVKKVAECLGRPYKIKGEVIHGDGRGKTIGVPTANLKLNHLIALPVNGVYIVEAILKGERYMGVVNIGSKPTFNKWNPSIELHIVDYSGDIYNEIIEVYFMDRIRSIKKFRDSTELVNQIKQDIIVCRKFTGKDTGIV
ncbi:Riboflavin biosynthesis protein RibF [Koleobacter methoxysyntrophicus]|jgi:riboflavin kinase/FMN adenylyltransferase|uniref:Riboflavin biosynthesis protein n=1 Tax=Koleobacter methoxysyntrophicus TaxID=2751313 RepID=A0A8A0RQU9_9FIRM|nr:bifunctional riboflavin kinase/FAD synthetase [Koleobacter methoxysyntrophicus]QSQ09940.1 Riboflavin biosynthesis protein RibF [Koleobacter methoxysyntrophicus]